MLSLLVLGIVHLVAGQASLARRVWHGRFLSLAAGLSFAYVFVDLLPALEKGQPALKRTFEGLIPYFDRHAYVIALIGVLFYYGLQTYTPSRSKSSFWIALSGYLIFNLFVGASLSDSTNPDIQPVTLFTIAMGMHYFVRDHSASVENPVLYAHDARWALVAALLCGYVLGMVTHIPDAVVAIAVSFIAGGVLLNVLHYELPKREQGGYLLFVLGALAYTVILLRVGEA